jgi:hypothetical protein
VTVTDTAHGYTTGNSLKIANATATGGISAGNLNGTRTITVVDVALHLHSRAATRPPPRPEAARRSW